MTEEVHLHTENEAADIALGRSVECLRTIYQEMTDDQAVELKRLISLYLAANDIAVYKPKYNFFEVMPGIDCEEEEVILVAITVSIPESDAINLAFDLAGYYESGRQIESGECYRVTLHSGGHFPETGGKSLAEAENYLVGSYGGISFQAFKTGSATRTTIEYDSAGFITIRENRRQCSSLW